MNILTFEDIIDITKYLVEKGYNKKGITVETTVTDRKLYEKLNEDIFYRLGGKEDEEVPKATDIINVNVGGITFRYIYNNNKEEEDKE